MLVNKEKFAKGVAIVGVGDTNYGELYRAQKTLAEPRDPYAMALEVTKEALDDAGLTRDEIDGVILVRDTPSYEQFCYKAGIKYPRLVNILEGAGRQSGLAVQYASMAILTGMASCVLIVYSNNGRSAGDTYGGRPGKSNPFDFGRVHGMTSPGAQVGSMFNRYIHEFGIPREKLGSIAINNRYHASLNPKAVFRNPLTMEDYLNARYIAEPLRLFDYCLINDGAVAMILTSVERAKNLRKPVVEILATSCCGDMGPIYAKEDFFYHACRTVAKDIYGAAGVTPKDIDCVQIYDNFTPTVFFGLEGFGFCERGEAADYIDEVGISLGKSPCPVNTSGSHTSESYMQGFNLHVEAVRQLRHECGERQVPNCQIAQYLIPAPIVTSHILARR